MDRTAQLLEQILAAAHPQMVDALCLAAVPDWFTPALFSILRQRDDGRDAGILERFGRYSFIERYTSETGLPIYTMRAEARDQLQRRWIAADPEAYREAHARALAYWIDNPDPNPFAQAQNRLYHLLFVDPVAGADWLIDRFRAYQNERHLAAIERLLRTADRAYTYLPLLDTGANLNELADLLAHLRARLAQLRGQWAESLSRLQTLWRKPDLTPRLRPYVARAYGQALAHTGDQAGAMDYYRQALQLFEQLLATGPVTADPAALATIQAERGHTLLALGDAYAALAASARGSELEERTAGRGLYRFLRACFYAFISLPLLVYLSFGLGRQVWRPRFWPQLRYLDWIIARLFAEAAAHYSKADTILENHGQPAEAVLADEKLAFLYLAVGDPYEAERLFHYLLAEVEAPLGPYRRALVRLGLAEALLWLGQRENAEMALQTTVPTLQEYGDNYSLAKAGLLLSQATPSPETAVDQAQQSIRLFQELGREVEATHVAEHLARLETAVSQPAEQTAIILNRYSYPVRYRHPTTVILQRLTLVLLTIIVFLIPVSTIRLETGTSLDPQINFNTSPLLDPDQADFSPALSQGISAIRLTPVPNPEVVIWLGLLLFGGYLLISTGLGLLAIWRTSPAKVQAAREERTVRLDWQQLQVGSSTLPLAQVKQLTRADVRIWQDILVDDSQLALAAAGQQQVVAGKTHWYEAVAERLDKFVPPSARRLDLSYRILSSKLGAWYLLTLLLLLWLAVLGLTAPPWMVSRPWGQPYSLVDLYPYLYLGLVLPPLWWFVIRPLQIHSIIRPRSTWPWWFGAVGLLLAGLRLAAGFRPWFTTPDIYPPLLIMVLLLAAAVVVWRRSHHPIWQRGVVLLLALMMLVPQAAQLTVDVVAYHYLISGHAHRDRALLAGEAPEASEPTAVESDLQRAVDAYSRAYDLSARPLFGFDRVTAVTNWGIPPRERIIWLAALNSRAAIYAQLGQFNPTAYGLAVADYRQLQEFLPNSDRVLANLALAYQSWGTVDGQEPGGVEPQPDAYDQAIAYLEEAIALSPRPEYYLWLGVAQHGLDLLDQAQASYLVALENEAGIEPLTAEQQAQAFTGLGWIAYEREEPEAAEEWFRQATEADLSQSSANVGLGYVYYNWRQYEAALSHWETAVALEPANPIIPISLGTLYWRLGSLIRAGEWSGAHPCGLPEANVSPERQTQWCWEQALAQFSESATLPGQRNADLAFTYRTMAQVTYLLRNSPDYEPLPTLQRAVDLYSEAIALDSNDPVYWHMRGRLRYAQWLAYPANTGPVAREPLLAALADQERALALNPDAVDDYRPQHWFDITYREAVEGTLAQGDRAFADGNYELARGYYELVAANRTEQAQAAFKTGLVALVRGDPAAAQRWYETGLERAALAGDEAVVQEAIVTLQTTTAVSPDDRSRLLTGLFSDGWQIVPATPAAAFSLALTAVEQADYVTAASYYERGLRLAAEAGDWPAAQQAATDLRDHLLANESVPVTEVYWPLFPERIAGVEPAVTELSQPDRYWRFRADFGLRIITEPFRQRPRGSEADYESIFRQIIADAERAATLSDSHQRRYEFYRDANIGWLYLQRAERAYLAEEYEDAAADYEAALRRIQPQTAAATGDYTSAVFGRALTAVALQDPATARTWFNTGLELALQNNQEAALQQAHTRLEQLLNEQPRLANIGQPYLTLLADELDS
jgi:hypothetical protein